MEIFSRFAGSSGFFLDSERFVQSFYAPEPFGHHLRPSRSLLSAVYLTSIALSGNEILTTHEPIFLSRALQYASQAPSCTHPSNAKHGLQAEILIANYFFLRGHMQEGKSHINTAMMISMVHRAHKIHRISNLDGVEVIEQWERVKGFWSAYLLDKFWSIAGGLPPSSPDGVAGETRIDAPWPLELRQFKNVGTCVSRLFRPSYISCWRRFILNKKCKDTIPLTGSLQTPLLHSQKRTFPSFLWLAKPRRCSIALIRSD